MHPSVVSSRQIVRRWRVLVVTSAFVMLAGTAAASDANAISREKGGDADVTLTIACFGDWPSQPHWPTCLLADAVSP